jgi:hypothetical protein
MLICKRAYADLHTKCSVVMIDGVMINNLCKFSLVEFRLVSLI